MPVLIVKVGRYVRDYGALGVIRSMGRVSVPVYTATGAAWTPTARSRFLTARIVAPTTGLESEDELLEHLRRVARDVGRPAICLPTDDKAAVFVAEHVADLRPWLVTPDMAPDLPRQLASKRCLQALCHEHGVPTPRAVYPQSPGDLESFAAAATFPVVAKPGEPWRHREGGGAADVHALPNPRGPRGGGRLGRPDGRAGVHP